MTDDKLRERMLPCPFCGGEAQRLTIGEDEPNNAGGDVICCTRCQASSHVEFGRKENLVSRWNTRAELTRNTAIADGLEGEAEHLRRCLQAARPYISDKAGAGIIAAIDQALATYRESAAK